MSAGDAYLGELRRALPVGCRRRLVAEIREHFASAVAAEAELGLTKAEAERVTIERLGPADALAAQLLADLRSGALGRGARLKAALTVRRLAVCGVAAAIAIVAGAVLAIRHSSPAPRARPQTARPSLTVTLDPTTGRVRMVMYAVQNAARRHQSPIRSELRPVPYYLTPAPPVTNP